MLGENVRRLPQVWVSSLHSSLPQGQEQIFQAQMPEDSPALGVRSSPHRNSTQGEGADPCSICAQRLVGAQQCHLLFDGETGVRRRAVPGVIEKHECTAGSQPSVQRPQRERTREERAFGLSDLSCSSGLWDWAFSRLLAWHLGLSFWEHMGRSMWW